MIRFHDKVTWQKLEGGTHTSQGEIPAHIAHSSAGMASSTGVLEAVEKVRALVPATFTVGVDDRLLHHGATYQVDGPPTLYRVKGRPHHLSVPLVRSV